MSLCANMTKIQTKCAKCPIRNSLSLRLTTGMAGLSAKPPEKVGKTSFYLASILFKI